MHEMRYERDRGRPPGEEQEEGPTADNGRRGYRIDEVRPKSARRMRERVDGVQEVVCVFHPASLCFTF